MNNKGQTLVIFVLLIPVLLVLLAITIDLGFLLNETNKVKQNIIEVIDYGLDSDSTNKEVEMYDILKLNIGNDKNINISTNNNIRVMVSGEYKSLFSKLIKNKVKYNYVYNGYIKDGEKIIKKEG